jgi:hypothetical protein
MSIPAKIIEKIKGLPMAVKVAVCVAIALIAVAVAVAIYYAGSSAPAAEEKKAPEPATEVVVPEIVTDNEEAETVTDPDAPGLIIDTAPKPEEGKELEYSIQKPKKVKEKEKEDKKGENAE